MLTILFHLALLFTPSFGFGLGSTYDQFLSDLLKWWGVDHCVIDFVYDDDKAGISNEIIAALSDRCEQIRKFIVQKLLLTLYLTFRHKVIIRRGDSTEILRDHTTCLIHFLVITNMNSIEAYLKSAWSAGAVGASHFYLLAIDAKKLSTILNLREIFDFQKILIATSTKVGEE